MGRHWKSLRRCCLFVSVYWKGNSIHRRNLEKFLTIHTFYCIKDRLIDIKKKKGAIYNKIAYKKYKKPIQQNKNHLQSSGNDDMIENEQSDDGIDELEFLLYFKTCLVDRDIEILKIKLSQSIEMREKLIKKKDTVFHKMFPFYFIQPTLVSFLSLNI